MTQQHASTPTFRRRQEGSRLAHLAAAGVMASVLLAVPAVGGAQSTVPAYPSTYPANPSGSLPGTSLAAAGAVAGVGGATGAAGITSRASGATAIKIVPEYVPVTVGEVTDHAKEWVGRHVSLSGQPHEIIAPYGFTLKEHSWWFPGEVLVMTPVRLDSLPGWDGLNTNVLVRGVLKPWTKNGPDTVGAELGGLGVSGTDFRPAADAKLLLIADGMDLGYGWITLSSANSANLASTTNPAPPVTPTGPSQPAVPMATFGDLRQPVVPGTPSVSGTTSMPGKGLVPGSVPGGVAGAGTAGSAVIYGPAAAYSQVQRQNPYGLSPGGVGGTGDQYDSTGDWVGPNPFGLNGEDFGAGSVGFRLSQ